MINLFGDVDVGRGSKLFVLMVILVYSIGIDDLDVISFCVIYRSYYWCRWFVVFVSVNIVR